MYLALSKRKFDILRRSLAEVVHMHNVVRQKFAFLHAFRRPSRFEMNFSLAAFPFPSFSRGSLPSPPSAAPCFLIPSKLYWLETNHLADVGSTAKLIQHSCQ